jgi:hypothetical protein
MGMPVNFDFAVFSFQVPTKGFDAVIVCAINGAETTAEIAITASSNKIRFMCVFSLD